MPPKWDTLSKQDRTKLLTAAGLPAGLSQLNWSGLQKSERKKLEKGKGWFEAKEPIMTARGIEHKAPEHHKVAIKKEAGKALNKPMERKEPIASKKLKEEWKQFNEELRAKAEQENQHKKEQYLTTEQEFIIVKPNSHRALQRIDTELDWKDNDYIEWKQYDVPLPIGSYRAFDGRYYVIPKIIDISKIKGLNIVKELPERAQLTFHKKGGNVLYPIKKEEPQKTTPIPASVLSDPQGIKRETEATLPQGIKLDADEEKFVRGIYKQVAEGATVKEFGTRLYVWRGDEAYATKHITDSEYMALKTIIKGVHQVSRADALKNLKEGREKEAKIVQEIEERKEQEAPTTPEEIMEQIIKSGKEREENEAEQLKKAREKWVAEARNPPLRKPAKTPEIEFNAVPPITKKEVPEVEGLVIRGLTEEQAEEFRNELKEKVRIKEEISIRKGTGGRHELYTQIPIDSKSIRGTLKLFTKHFGKKPKHITKGEPAQEPMSFLVEYKCGDEPPIKVPIEKLDEEIERCKKEGEEHYKDLGLTGQGEAI